MGDWKRIEALLFASGKYLAEEYISEVTRIKGKPLKSALKELEEHYEKTDTSLKLFREGNNWKLNVKEEYSDIVNKIITETELPSYVMATLAVIAYKNPVLQSEVINMRGSNAYEHIKMLEEKGFIKKEKHGRTYKLKVSDKFFEYFDVKSEADIQHVFKDVKKPEKLGELQVYEADEENDNGFEERIVGRMKKVEKHETEENKNKQFLDSFEERINKVKEDIDEAENEIAGMKPRMEEASDKEQKETPGEKNKDENFINRINKEIDEITGEEPEEEKD